MRRNLAALILPLLAAALSPGLAREAPDPNTVRLEKANVLPLALDDHYEFRKVQEFMNDSRFYKPTVDQMIAFERERINFGALTSVDRNEVRGQYYHFFWRTKEPGPITVRFEYRQANLGAYVQAKEISYGHAKGSIETKFQVVGDDYLQDGRIIAWRALLIKDGKIVGLTQSYLWD